MTKQALLTSKKTIKTDKSYYEVKYNVYRDGTENYDYYHVKMDTLDQAFIAAKRHVKFMDKTLVLKSENQWANHDNTVKISIESIHKASKKAFIETDRKTHEKDELWYEPKALTEIEVDSECFDQILALGTEGIFKPLTQSGVTESIIIDLELIRDIRCDINIDDLYEVLLWDAPIRTVELDNTHYLYIRSED